MKFLALLILAVAPALAGTVSIVRERAVCDGYDVAVRLPSGAGHVFHFLKRPADVQAACDAAYAAYAAAETAWDALPTLDSVAADLRTALAAAQVANSNLDAARSLAEAQAAAVKLRTALIALAKALADLRSARR